MIFISEETSRRVLDVDSAFEAVERSFAAAAAEGCTTFPAVLGHAADDCNRFSVKSASRGGGHARLSGAKIGFYWPGNVNFGLARHNSCILIFDETRGGIAAVIEAGGVNGLRTAAADAVAAAWLSRADSHTLAVFGAGAQARYEVEALRRVRDIDRVLIVNRDMQKARDWCDQLSETGVDASPACAEQACRLADIIITVTGAREPLFDADWVRPGTHVASMGSDAAGKQELPPPLLRRGRLFSDLPSQSVRIGEFQSMSAEIESGSVALTAIGSVISGTLPGRCSNDDLTIFDSSGIALQDLFIGEQILHNVNSKREMAHA